MFSGKWVAAGVNIVSPALEVRVCVLPSGNVNCVGIGKEHRKGVGMAVHDRFLVWAVMHFQDPNLIVFGYD